MLHVDQNEKLPLHTFLPSSTEVLPLLLPVPVVVVVAMAVVVMATAMMVHLVTVAVVVVFAMRIIMDVPLLAPLVIFINSAVDGVCWRIC